MFSMILGCKILTKSTTVENTGLFEIFKNLETIENVFGNIIPARQSTGCKCRRTARCSVDHCFRAVSGIMAGHSINWIERSVRM